VLFVVAAVVVLSAAEPFGRSLVDTRAALGLDEFLLVQWLAPVASEAPEVIVAITFALRGRADDGLGALLAHRCRELPALVRAAWSTRRARPGGPRASTATRTTGW
jgi:cation:H+ antiporter